MRLFGDQYCFSSVLLHLRDRCDGRGKINQSTDAAAQAVIPVDEVVNEKS